MERPLADRVREAYRNASEENGYPIGTWSAERVALDMVYCCADLEDEDPVEVARIVREMRMESAE